MNKKLDRGRETREQLLTIATRLFTERGDDGTSIEAVLSESGLSRGALYHHFNGKEALFSAALESLYEHVDRQLRATARSESDPISALRAGCLAWIRLATDPAVRQILLIDAPSVLAGSAGGALMRRALWVRFRRALQTAAEQQLLPVGYVDFFAHALLASMNEIAPMIAQSPEAGGK